MSSSLIAETGRFVRSNVSSIVATGLTWLVVIVATAAGVHYLVAAAMGALAGAVTDFSMKRHWAFGRDEKDTATVEGARYLTVSAGSLGWNLLVSYALVDGLGLYPTTGVIVASVVVGIAWNYPLHRLFVFRELGGEQEGAAAAETIAEAGLGGADESAGAVGAG